MYRYRGITHTRVCPEDVTIPYVCKHWSVCTVYSYVGIKNVSGFPDVERECVCVDLRVKEHLHMERVWDIIVGLGE